MTVSVTKSNYIYQHITNTLQSLCTLPYYVRPVFTDEFGVNQVNMLSCYGIICLEFTTGVHTVRVQLLLLESFYGPFSGTTRVSRCQKRNFWILWCKGKLTEEDTLTIWLGATPSGLISANLHHPPIFYRPDALPAAQPTVSKH